MVFHVRWILIPIETPVTRGKKINLTWQIMPNFILSHFVYTARHFNHVNFVQGVKTMKNHAIWHVTPGWLTMRYDTLHQGGWPCDMTRYTRVVDHAIWHVTPGWLTMRYDTLHQGGWFNKVLHGRYCFILQLFSIRVKIWSMRKEILWSSIFQLAHHIHIGLVGVILYFDLIRKSVT